MALGMALHPMFDFDTLALVPRFPLHRIDVPALRFAYTCLPTGQPP
jgi:hypothetical protein